VVVSGHVENDTWRGQDGVEHFDLRLIVSDIQIKSPPEPRRFDEATAESPTESAPSFDFDDEIPF
jgi:single-stranded DNA-binding protein